MDAPGGHAARFEVVEFCDQHLRIDDAAGADHAVGAGIEDPRRQVVKLVGLLADDHRVPRVRPAVVAAHEIRVAREQVDDLALPFVAPLRADDHGRGHAASLTQEPSSGCSYAQAMRRWAVLPGAALAAAIAAGATASAPRHRPAIRPVRVSAPVWTFVQPSGK